VKTIIYIKWLGTGDVEHFRNLSNLYKKYDITRLGVSIHTLNRKNLTQGYKNEIVEIIKNRIQ
jgi:hypothetical protein